MTNTSKHIWIIEDETRIAEVVTAYLQQAGFEVSHFADGDGLVERVRAGAPDLMLLDLMLPGSDGMELCKQVRAFSQVPIIMVTARVEEIDRLLGLEFGADDYICKPFSPREVVARVKTVLRRTCVVPETVPTTSEEPGERYQCAGFVIDNDQFMATLDDTELGLTPKEFKLLAAFVAQPGRVFSREQLMDRMYMRDEYFSDRMIDSHLKNLRKKISAINPDLDCIQTVYGIGYRFTP